MATSPQLRVAHVITRMIIGGAQENTLFNCLDLAKDFSDQVLLICGPETGPEGDLIQPWRDLLDQQPQRGRAGQMESTRVESKGIQVQILNSFRRDIHPLHDWKAAGQLRKALQDFRPDVVHTHSAKGGLLGRQAAWKLKTPAVIHTVHGAPFHDYQSAVARKFFIACERWAAKRCHHLISVADAMTDLMVDAGVATRDRFTTIHSGMDVQPFLEADRHRQHVRERFGFRQEHVVIGKIARLFRLKGHEDLIRAARLVVDACPQVRFLLVGDGILRQPLQQQIAESGLTDHFVFSGLVPPTEVPAMIGAMDLLVHTSYREGLARALPQALIASKPVVSYDIDGAREVVLNDETGYLVNPGDESMLAKRLIELAGDPARRERQGRAGRSRFAQQFDHRFMTRRIRELYQQVLAR